MRFLQCIAFAVVVLVVIALYRSYGKQRADSVQCGNNMSSIGFAARQWAEDNGGRLPSEFSSMSNELSTTKILICPADHDRLAAKNFATLDITNSSYEIIAPGMTNVSGTTNVYFKCNIHGHLGYADGTVFDGKRRRTKVFR